MDEALLAMRTGRLAFAEFERRSRPVWKAIAQTLLRRWKGPLAVSIDDVVQELVVHAWIFAGHWDRSKTDAQGRPMSISKFVVFNATDKAKKWLHQQRNAYRRDDKAAGRIERPLSSMNLSEYAEEHILDAQAHPASQEDAFTQREVVLALAVRAAPEHRPALAALARTGDVELAAQRLYQSKPACIALRLEGVDDARLAVSRALQSVAAAS